MVKVITDGRTDLDDYFKLSGIFEDEELKHTPFLVFIPSDDTVAKHPVGSQRERAFC